MSKSHYCPGFFLLRHTNSITIDAIVTTTPKYQPNTAAGPRLTEINPQSYPQSIQTHLDQAAMQTPKKSAAMSALFRI